MKKILSALCVSVLFMAPSFGVEENDGESDFSRRLRKDEVYSLTNKIESKKYSTAGVEVITSDDIENQNSPVISELLNSLTGVTVQRSGSIGDMASFRIRGTDRVRTTVDGIRADSPSDGKFYLNNYLSDDIERIEVVRGPQGNMAGTQASGGLVGLFTKRGYGEGKIDLSSEFGSFNTFKERIAYSMGDEKKDFYLSTTYLRTAGGLEIDDPQGSYKKLRHDGYKNFNVVGNLGYRVLEGKGELRQIFRFNNSKKQVGINGYGDTLIEDFNDYSRNLDIVSTSIFNFKPNEVYDSSTRFGVFHTRYNFYQFEDDFDPTYLADENEGRSRYRGTRLNFITQHNFNYKDWNQFSIGYNMEYENYKASSWYGPTMWGAATSDSYGGDSIQNDVFINDTINIKDILFLKGGVRMINNSLFGTYFTPNGSAALILPTFNLKGASSKLRGSWGQSISAPTFYQMFGEVKGMQLPNHNLRPEKLNGYDFGFEQTFFDEKLGFEFGYFNNKYDDYINWDGGYPGRYVNIDSAKISGYEAGIRWQPNHIFRLNLNYTYSDSKDDKTGTMLVGVPKNRVNAGLFVTPNERFTLFANVEAADDRAYAISGGKEKKVGGYVDVALGGKIKLFSFKKMHVFLAGTVYNLLNQRISMYKGYYQPGVHFNAGLFVEFRGLGENL